MKAILITGGSGFIGSSLTELLLQKGYIVNHLSRSAKPADGKVNVFKWDVVKGEIDPACIEQVDTVIHLAGEGIADRPWTNARKAAIINSRTASIRLIYSLLERTPNHGIKALISSSAVGFYGNGGDAILHETSPPGTGFLARTCEEWEIAAEEGARFFSRIVKLRTGVVLDKGKGALPQIAKPILSGLGSPLGDGKQWVPWIHIADLISIYAYVLENESLAGVFNATAPNPVTNTELTEAIASKLGKTLWLPKVPAFMLKIILGEMSKVVLNSNRTSAENILSSGFSFEFNTIEKALNNIYD